MLIGVSGALHADSLTCTTARKGKEEWFSKGGTQEMGNGCQQLTRPVSSMLRSQATQLRGGGAWTEPGQSDSGTHVLNSSAPSTTDASLVLST